MNEQNETWLTAKRSLRTGSRTFFFASFFLQSDVANKAARLYRFCRYVDDVVDLAKDSSDARQSIQTLLSDFDRTEPKDREIIDARDLFLECGIPLWIPRELILGVESDVEGAQIDSEDDLLRYSFRVAGTVGLMMCYVLGIDDVSARNHAVDLGIAMQLTNILRDVKEDAMMGRRYIPSSWVPGISSKDLLSPSETIIEKRIIKGLERIHLLSELYYKSGFMGLAYIPIKSRYAILVAGEIYRNIGLTIKDKGYKFIGERVVIPLLSKVLITLREVICATLSKYFWLGPRAHEQRLHAPIAAYPISPQN
jgi:phytoene synthase